MDATAEPVEGTNQKHPTTPDATRTPAELFRYSAWVHVGVGAEGCENAETGDCADPEHFHAWCRLPNQFQHQDIRERALAAKARRMRQLRDPDSDAYVILLSELDTLPGQREAMIEELMTKDWSQRYLEALADVEEDDKFELVDRDRDRFRELQQLPEDERPSDEYAELERHFASYAEAIDARRKELDEPIREALEGLSEDELVAQVRDFRISEEGSAAFHDVYARWQWFAGAFTKAGLDRQRRFASMEALEEAAPEVVERLRETYADLETSLQRGQRGN
jgi:hypothetical protein